MNFFRRQLSYHCLRGVPTVYRSRAFAQAQETLADYLHATRSLPFAQADHISTKSPSSLSALLSECKFSSPDVAPIIHRFLRYHPINEFDFFFESIGFPPSEIPTVLPPKCFFLSDQANLVPALQVLFQYGFPWNKLCRIYKEEASVFSQDPATLKSRLRGFEALGFDRFSVVGICLAFPSVLAGEDAGVAELLNDLKMVFFDFDLASSFEGNVDACYELCRKIRVFYDLGCQRGKTGELIGRIRDILLEHAEEVFVEKADFFCRLGARKEEVGMFLLHFPEVLNFDFEGPVITVSDYLERAGLNRRELRSLLLRYPHVSGKNRLKNLPQLMRALDLHGWFRDKIMSGDHHLLRGFVAGNAEEELEKDFTEETERIKYPTKEHHTFEKLDFLLHIGFGNNKNTVEMLRHLHGTRSQLQERFDRLLQMGFPYSLLCEMINVTPKILNGNTDMLQKKVNYFFNEMNCSLQQLCAFPTYLLYDLENRIKPRFRFLSWLGNKGLSTTAYSPTTILAATENKFIGYLIRIHRAAPKQWLELFSPINSSNGHLET